MHGFLNIAEHLRIVPISYKTIHAAWNTWNIIILFPLHYFPDETRTQELHVVIPLGAHI